MLVKYIVYSIALTLLITLHSTHARSIRNYDYCLNNPSCVQGETTIPGTWMWDIDKNKLGSSDDADLWWSHNSRSSRELVPVNNAFIKHIKYGACHSVGPEKIMRFDNLDHVKANAGFTQKPLDELVSRAVIKKGAIFAVITNKHQLARLCIRGFRSNQDYNFKEAELLDKPTTIPGRGSLHRYYHIILDWTLFKDFDLMPYMENPE